MNTDESDYVNDNKYRNFATQVDKCLKGFEYSSEWADLITNLGKITKLLQANNKIPVIPRKHLIGKRLSQCLHPALPAGVHIKSLECLDIIFKNIGSRRLSEDLFIYSNGIFPLLSPSGMQIKKPLFDLYENHFIPLGLAIRPAFVGLLQGLLPGLEEGAEFYERGNSILEKFCVAVEPIYFYTCLWQVMLQAPSVRAYGTAFLLNHFNRRLSTDDQLFFFGNSISLMLNSLTHILNDQQVLVQRQALDFVLFALNMHRSQLTVSDREKLCAACLTVLLRRDMSLNRRFYSWLLGTHLDRAVLIKYVANEETDYEKHVQSVTDNELQLKYFKKYSRDILISALKWIIDHPVHTIGDRLASIKPFRIITTLMDRAEIGGDIIEDVLFNLIVYLEREYFVLEKQSNDSSKTLTLKSNSILDSSLVREPLKSKSNLQEEFLKTANLFFANLDSGFFWKYLNQLFMKALNQEVIPSLFQNFQMTIGRICDLVKFILIRLPIDTYSDVHRRHLPDLFLSLTDLLVEHVPNLGLFNIKMILQVYRMIFEKIFQSTAITFESGTSPTSVNNSNSSVISKQTLHSFSIMSQNNSVIMSRSIYKFREFSKKFFIFVMGCPNDQISGCVNSLFFQSPKKFRLSKRDEVPILYNKLNLSLSIDSTVIEVYHDICQLLVEMTSYPLYFAMENEIRSHNEEIKEISSTVKNHKVYEWFGCLITSACFINNFLIKSIAMSTILDLIYASRLVYGHKNQPNNAKSNNIKKHIIAKGRTLSSISEVKEYHDAANTSVNVNRDLQQQLSNTNIILPLLSEIVIGELDNETNFFTLAGLSLWDFLSTSHPQCHQVTVDLINRLHKTAPSASICEELMLQKMLTDNLEECLDSHRRFILLWQLLAKQEVSPYNDPSSFLSNGGSIRTFDKCVLVLLDSLDHSSDSNHGFDALRTLCQSWLEKAFQDGHAHKIISPLLLALLKPDTARISLQNLIKLSASKLLKDPSTNEAYTVHAENMAMCSEEKRIYAISHTNGEVQYHLKPKPQNEQSNNNDKTNKRAPIFVIQTLDLSTRSSSKSKNVVKRAKSESLTESNLNSPSTVNRFKKYPMHLHINPLDETGITSSDETNKCQFQDDFLYNPVGDGTSSNSGEELSVTLEHKDNDHSDSDIDNYPIRNVNQSSNSVEPNVKESLEEIITNVVSVKEISDNWDNASYLEDDGDEVASPVPGIQCTEEISDLINPEIDYVDEGVSTSNLNSLIYPLHNHLLVYCSIYDSSGVLYSLSRLRIIIRSLSGIVVPVLGNLISMDNGKSIKSDGVLKPKAFYQNKIFEILSRHLNALKGVNFYQNPTLEEISICKNYNQLETIMILCSWFMSSYYPVTDNGLRVSIQDIFDNKKVQILASEILDLIVHEMLTILQIGYVNHKGDFVTPSKTKMEIKNVFKTSFDRCNIARYTLHCMSTSITRSDNNVAGIWSDSVISQNENDLDQRVRDSATVTWMRLVLNVLKLDYGLNTNSVLSNVIKIVESSGSTKSLTSKPVKNEVKLPLPTVHKNLLFTCYQSSNPYIAVSRQSILLTSLVVCIGAIKLRHLHSFCYQFVISSLGVWGRSTSAALMPIVKKLCKNIRSAARLYETCSKIVIKTNDSDKTMVEHHILPLDYSLSTLSCLKAVCHFLLLDEALKSYQLQEEKGSSSEQGFLGALFNRSKDNLSKEDSMSPGTHILEARLNMIKLMSRMMDSLLILWERSSLSEIGHFNQDNIPPSWTMGRPDKVREMILSIIKPLLQQHPTIILISIARVWPQLDQFKLTEGNFSEPDLIQDICLNETSTSLSGKNELNKEQYRVICILELARGWKKSFTIVQIISTCKEIIRKPFQNTFNASSITSKKLLEKEEGQVKVNLLEFLQCFLITGSASKLSLISSSLFGLLKESSSNLPPTAAFILLKILSDFISKVSISEDKREQREIQDLCQKVLENVALIAGSSLEQPSWFRRAAQVKLDNDVGDETTVTHSESSSDFGVVGPMNTVNELQCEQPEIIVPNMSNNDLFNQQNIVPRFGSATLEFRESRISLPALTQGIESSNKMATINIRCPPSSKTLTLQALNLLTLHLASIIDVTYKSEEKEKVQPFLNSVIFPNVLPYLRYRSYGNVLNFRISTQLVASLSSYQHTRRSWRKDIFDLLFESYFFQFDIVSIKSWKIIIDNLMTQDKSTFKEAYTKLTVTQSTGLNLFTNKEAEYDQTAMCIKKMAFIIYSSELDQYVKSMPEIQERFSESLRLGMIPQIKTQLFLCFRVLLMRVSHQHLTSLWHIFIPTLTTVLQCLSDDLKCDTRSTRFMEIHRRLPMYLSACKLLDMILLMQEDSVPQFLYYKWAFVGNLDESNDDFGRDSSEIGLRQSSPAFRPFLTLIIDSYLQYCFAIGIPISSIEVVHENLFNEKPIIYRQSIQSIMELASFFFTASLRNDLNQESRITLYGIKIVNNNGNSDMETDVNLNFCDRFFNFEHEVEKLLDSEFIEPLNKS